MTVIRQDGWQRWVRIEGIDRKSLNLIADSLINPIRNYSDEEELRTILALEVQRLASIYGARGSIEDHILLAAVDLILNRFKMLSVAELSHAFELAASGEIKANLTMYHGSFNNQILGSVLGAYREFRRKAIAGLIKAEAQLLERKKLKDQQALKLKFDQEFPEMIARAKEKIKHWQEIPVFWYPAAKRLGLLHFKKGEMMKIYEEAKALVRRDIETIHRLKGTMGTRSSLKSNLHKLEAGDMEKDIRAVARKLSVYRKLIKEDKK